MPASQQIQRQVHMYFLHQPLFCATYIAQYYFYMELACPQRTIKYIDPYNAHLVVGMLECEGQLSCLKERTVPSNNSTG